MKKTIAIDMDGVIADVETQFLLWYERDYGIKVSRNDLLGFNEDEAFPDKKAVRKFVTTPGFFKTLPVMANAINVVKELMEHYDIYIVSAAMEFPLSLYEKYNWLQEHFPFIGWQKIIFCGDKKVINTDYLIDDHGKNLDFFKGTSLMFTSFHNVNQNHHHRLNDWLEVRNYFNNLQ